MYALQAPVGGTMKKLSWLAAVSALLIGSSVFVSCGGSDSDGGSDPVLDKITVDASAAKTVFAVGDDFSAEGLSVKAVMSDKTKKTLSADEYTVALAAANLGENGKIIRATENGHSEEAVVTVTYEEKTAAYNVTVSDVVTKLELTIGPDAKAEYDVGEEFDPTDITVKAFYGDDDTVGEDVTESATFTVTVKDDEGNDVEFTTDEPGTFEVTLAAEYAGKTASVEATVIVVDPDDVSGYDAPNLSSYYKKYFVTTEADVDKFTRGVDSWGCGGNSVENDDGTLTLTPGTGWGGSTVVAAFTNIGEGALGLYEYLVLTLDLSNATIINGDGNNGVNIKIPEVQKAITDNWVKNSDGTRTYYAKLSDWSTTATAHEFALIAGAEGTVIVKEVYAAAAEDPASIAITGITITPAAGTLAQGGKQQFTVKDSSLNDVTSSVEYTLTGDAAEGSTITEAGLLTVGTTAGSLTVTAKYTVDETDFTAEATITVMGAMTNLVSSVTLEKYTDASGAGDDVVTISDGVATVAKPAASGWGAWSSQLWLTVTSEEAPIFETGKKYYIAATLKSDADLTNCVWKGDDAAGYLLEEGIALTANVEKTIVKEVTFSASFDTFQSIFAFGENGAANITVSNITVYDITE